MDDEKLNSENENMSPENNDENENTAVGGADEGSKVQEKAQDGEETADMSSMTYEQFMSSSESEKSADGGNEEELKEDGGKDEDGVKDLSDGSEKGNEAVTDESASEDSEKSDKGKPKKKAKKGLIASVFVILLALIVVIGALIFQRSKTDLSDTVLSVDGVDSSAYEFVQYFTYYKQQYSYYGQSVSDDDLKKNIIQQLEFNNACYKNAVADKLELSGEALEEMTQMKENLSKEAESQSKPAEDVIADIYGKSATLDMYYAFVEKQELANLYQTKIYDDLRASYENGKNDDKITKEYNKDTTKYDLSDAYYVSLSGDNAEKQSQAIQTAVKGGTSFVQACNSVTKGESTAKNLSGYTYDTLNTEFSEQITKWLFAQSDGKYTTKAGSMKAFDVNGGTYLVYVNNTPSRDDSKPATIKYVFVSPEQSKILSEDELLNKAQNTAEEIYSEYIKSISGSKADESKFDAAVKKFSASNVTTNTMEKVSKSTSDIDYSVRSWLAESGRKEGDCTVIDTSSGAYVIYVESLSSMNAWKQTISDAMIQNDYEDWQSDFTESYQNKITVDNDAIEKAVDYANKILTKSSSNS
jgi:hypothetical protein